MLEFSLQAVFEIVPAFELGGVAVRNLLCLLLAALGLIPIAAAQQVQYSNPWNAGYPQAGYPVDAYYPGTNVQAVYAQPAPTYDNTVLPQGSPGAYEYAPAESYLHAQAPCASANCGHCCPSQCSTGRCLHRSGVFGEFLYWKASGADTSFGVIQDGIGPPGTVPLGEVGVLQADYQPSFRTGAALALNCNSSVSLAVTKYESNTNCSLFAPAPLVIQPLVTFPGTVNAGFTAQFATADSSLELDMLDIEYRAVLLSCSRYYLNFMVGIRYAELDQSFGAVFPFAPPDGTTFIATELDFEGGGMRIGLDGERFLWPRLGVSVYGKGSAGALGGEFSGNYVQFNQFNGIESLVLWDDERLVPMADLELGLRWSSPRERLKLSAGYYMGIWSNVVTTAEWINGVQAYNFVDISNDAQDTLRFDGLVARAEVRL